MMDRIIREVEGDAITVMLLDANQEVARANPADAVCAALRQTRTSYRPGNDHVHLVRNFPAMRAARERPEAPILSLTPSRALPPACAGVGAALGAIGRGDGCEIR